MVEVHPFSGVRYDPAVVGDVGSATAPAFDDIEPVVYTRSRTANPYTVLELLAEHPDGTYDHAGEVLRRWRRTGVLASDPTPAIYRYEEHHLVGGVPLVQRGICAAITVTPFEPDAPVLPHERTDTARVADRAARLRAVPLDVSPVFGLYREAPDALREVLDTDPERPPLVAITDEAGIDHRIWRLSQVAATQIQRAMKSVQVVIADGHHRYATALSLAQNAGRNVPGRTLAYLVDAQTHGPQVQPIHRLIRRAPRDLLDQLRRLFHIQRCDRSPSRLSRQITAHHGRQWGLYLRTADGPRAYMLEPRDDAGLVAVTPSAHSTAWRELDTAVLHHAVLPNVGVAEHDIVPRSHLESAVEEVRTGNAEALFLLREVGIDTVLDLAQRGELMPAKSTAFHPKPRTGLLMRDANEDHLP